MHAPAVGALALSVCVSEPSSTVRPVAAHRIHVLPRAVDVHVLGTPVDAALRCHVLQELRVALPPHRLADEVCPLVKAVRGHRGCRSWLTT